MVHEREYEPEYIKGFTTTAKRRYLKVHTQKSMLKETVTKYSTGRRIRGRPYLNYHVRLPKKWANGLELQARDNFEWSVISYDPVILQLRKLEGDSA